MLIHLSKGGAGDPVHSKKVKPQSKNITNLIAKANQAFDIMNVRKTSSEMFPGDDILKLS